MNKTELLKLNTQLKRQKTFYQNKALSLQKEIREMPGLFKENLCSYKLLWHRFLESEERVKQLLNGKCDLKKMLEHSNARDMETLIERNTFLSQKLNMTELKYNQLVFMCRTPKPKSRKPKAEP